MRGRWSFGVVVAVVVAVCVATSSGAQSVQARHASEPMQVTLALEPAGASLRISHNALAVTLQF